MNELHSPAFSQKISPASAMAAGTRSHLGKTIQNLAMLLEYEQRMLMDNEYSKMEALAADKHRLLGQLESVISGTLKTDLEDHSEQLRQLKEKLARNMKSLKFRATAISELAQTIEDAMDRAQSDGTYDPVALHRYGA
jgi:ABC-type transporter Mla subunit MlaD